LVISHLSREHNQTIFDCGVDEMNRYLRENALQDAEKHLSRTFVALGEKQDVISGFYTLVSRHIAFAEMPDERPKIKYPVHTVLLAQLAVDKNFHKQGLGERLLMDAQARVHEISLQLDVYAMILDARTEELANWYAMYDFKCRAGGPLQMYKSIKSIIKLGLIS
jgi:GNAT superfamily N-acetyltransferase